MTQNKHTPGPWALERETDTGPSDEYFRQWWAINGPDGEKIAEVDRLKDARLIAAAPDLLAALSRTLDLAIGHACEARKINPDECESWPWVQKARAAIRKAEGE